MDTDRLGKAGSPGKPQTAGTTRKEAILLSVALIAIFVAYGGLGRDIFFNPLVHPGQYDPIGAVLLYVRLGLCGGLVCLMVLHLGLMRAAAAIPVGFLPFAIVALASCFWTVDLKITLRSASVLMVFYLAVSLIVRRIGRQEVASLVLRTAAIIVVASALLAILLPSIGVHSANDPLQSSHAGRWRGIFQHKNGLGPWGAYAFTLLLLYGSRLRIPIWFRWIGCFFGVLCLVFSGSVTAVVGALTIISAAALLGLHRKMAPALLALTILISGSVAIYAVQSFQAGLLPAFGRDDSFSGRTEIWPIAISYIQQRLGVGSGYSTIGGPGFFALTREHFNQSLGPENAYLAQLLDLGVIGFACFFGAVGFALWKAIVALNRVDEAEGAAIKMFAVMLLATLTMSVTEATPYVLTGFTGFANFTALFALLSISVERRVVRSNWQKPARRPPLTIMDDDNEPFLPEQA